MHKVVPQHRPHARALTLVPLRLLLNQLLLLSHLPSLINPYRRRRLSKALARPHQLKTADARPLHVPKPSSLQPELRQKPPERRRQNVLNVSELNSWRVNNNSARKQVHESQKKSKIEWKNNV